MVLMVRIGQKQAVQPGTCFVHQSFPDRISGFGGTKGKQAEGGIGDSVFRHGICECLSRHAPGGKIDQVVAVQLALPGGAVELANGQHGVTGFIYSPVFPLDRDNGAILVYR